MRNMTIRGEDLHLAHSCPECGGDRDYPGLCDACSRPRLSLREQADAILKQHANRLVSPQTLADVQLAVARWLECALRTAGIELMPQVSISAGDSAIDIYIGRRSDVVPLRLAGFDMVGFARLHDLRIEVPDNDHRLIGWLLFRT